MCIRDSRYFEPAYDWKVLEFRGKKLAVTICEDIWNMGDNPLYRITPMEQLMPYNPDVMINLSASPYNYAQDIVRNLSLIHISEPTRLLSSSYAVFCLK